MDINECMDQNRFKQIIKNNLEIVLPMMFKSHNIELATIIGIEEKKININLLHKMNAKSLQSLMRDELVKLKLADNKRHILNILVNFFKSHQLIEDELNYLKQINEEATRMLSSCKSNGNLQNVQRCILKLQ